MINRDPSKASLVRQRIMGIFDCSWPLLQSLNKNSFNTIRKVSTETLSRVRLNDVNCLVIVSQRGLMCGKSSPRVIKTIRLRRAGLLPWILDTEVRIVHLVRDPRAIITSVTKVSQGPITASMSAD